MEIITQDRRLEEFLIFNDIILVDHIYYLHLGSIYCLFDGGFIEFDFRNGQPGRKIIKFANAFG